MNPPAVISSPHPLAPTFHSLFLSFLLPGCILPPLSRITIGKLSEAKLIIRYLLFPPPPLQSNIFGLTNKADTGGFRYGEEEGEV